MSEANLKSEENPNQNTEEPSGCKKLLQPKFLIPIIAGAVVVIVLVVVLCVVLIDNDDSSSYVDTFDYSGVDENWVEYYKKANKYLNDFTLDDKIMLLYSTENLIGTCVGSIDPNKDRNFPGICLQDGPAGVRLATNQQHWQAAINTAATFNRDLMNKVGVAQGKEFKDKGVNIMLAPCMNILRNPLGGRVWEAYGEDPFLSGEAAVQIIKGIQSQGVIACAKHYVANEIEDPRHFSSSNVPEQALWEIYIEPFYKSVKKGDVASIMESYNAVNNTFMTRNKRLLQEILKDKIGYAGFIMSDWWAINTDSYENFDYGLDMNMPGGPESTTKPTGKDGSWWAKIPDWIKEGHTSEERVNDACRRIIAAMYKLGQLTDSTLNDNDLYPKYVHLDTNTRTDDTIKLNRDVGGESIVLLKNLGDFLPLANNKKITHTYSSIKVFGNSAAESECLKKFDCTCKGDESSYEAGEKSRYFTGYVGLGWGSGTTHFGYQVTPLSAIQAKASSLSKTFDNSTNIDGNYRDGFTEVLPSTGDQCKDVNIVFIAANSGEEYIIVENNVGDRNDLNAWHGGSALVDKVLELCDQIVLVILGPATVNIKSTWKNNDKIKAILFGGMLGAEGGNAIADILFGDVVPSGHLPFVWASVESYPNVTKQTETSKSLDKIDQYNYNEGLFIGQRYIDKKGKSETEFAYYPFGYGLSYTTFTINSLSLTMTSSGLTVKFTVKNTGEYDGKVVPMVFLKFPLENYPEKVLKGFDKKLIKKGESANFEIFIDDHDLSYYDVEKADFVRPTSGQYHVNVGLNADEIASDSTVGAVSSN